jgi:hypothetical protein
MPAAPRAGCVRRAAPRWPGLARITACVAVVLALAAPALAQDDAGWQLKQEDPEVPTRVWLRDRPGGVPAFRATTVIDARLSSLAAVLLDGTRTQDWVYRARQSIRLRSDGPTRGTTLVVSSMPFPLSDRESVVEWEMTQDPATLTVTMAGHSTTDAPPPHPERVRMPTFESRWVFAPRPDGRVDVLFEGVGDPGGNLALPVIRAFVAAAIWQGPWSTIRALHEIVRQPPYPQAELPFIREPAR